MLYSRSLLVICFIYNSVYMLIPNFWAVYCICAEAYQVEERSLSTQRTAWAGMQGAIRVWQQRLEVGKEDGTESDTRASGARLKSWDIILWMGKWDLTEAYKGCDILQRISWCRMHSLTPLSWYTLLFPLISLFTSMPHPLHFFLLLFLFLVAETSRVKGLVRMDSV